VKRFPFIVPWISPGGFTLVMTLSILAAVTILVVGLFAIVARERQTSTSFDAVEQADLAVQAALEQAGALLKEALKDENGLIMAVPAAPWITALDAEADPEKVLQNEDGRNGSMPLMAVRRQGDGSSANGGVWTYAPLVSGVLSSEQQGPLRADPVLAELRRVSRPVMPGSFQNGQPDFTLTSAKSYSTAELTELKKVAQRVARVTPWQRTPAFYWVDLRRPTTGGAVGEAEGEVAGRFAFYVEDLQGFANLGVLGNVDPATPDEPPTRLHSRAEMKLPNGTGTGGYHAVPGLNIADRTKPRLNQASLHTLLQPTAEPLVIQTALNTQWSALTRRLIELRPLMFFPGAWREAVLQADPLTGWQGLEERLLRVRHASAAEVPAGAGSGSLRNPPLRALEENVVAGLRAYDELALIPHDPALVKPAGARKLNLNAILAEMEPLAGQARMLKARQLVNQMAAHIQQHLPQFARQRMGGYPFPNPPPPTLDYMEVQQAADRALAYLRCLAAGIIDYADTDALPTMDGNALADPNENSGKNYPTYRGMDSYPLVSEQWQGYRLEPSAPAGKVRYSVTTFLELWNMTNQDMAGEVAAAFECKGDVTVGFAQHYVNESLGMAVSGVPQTLPGVGRGSWHAPVRLDPPLRPNEYRVIRFEPVVFDFPKPVGVVNSVQFAGRDGSGNDWSSRYRLAYKPPTAGAFVVVDQPLRPVDRNQRTTTASNRQFFNTTNPAMSHGNRVARRYQNNLGDPRAAFFLNDKQALVSYEDGSSPWGRNVRGNIKDEFYGQNRTYLWPDGGHDSAAPVPPGSLARDPDHAGTRPARHAQNNLGERQKFVQILSNRGRYESVTELGHVFDPIMWDPNGGKDEFNETTYIDWANLRTGDRVDASHRYGGGNTLRIGRVEHERFRADYSGFPAPGRPTSRALSATALLDVFHCGVPSSAVLAERLGDWVRIDGHVNLNTATRDTLRALVAGRLVMDPQLKLSSGDPQPGAPGSVELQAPTSRHTLNGGGTAAHADLLAELIIRNRPYLSPAELPEKVLMPSATELEFRPLPKGMQIEPVKGRVLVAREPVLGAVERIAGDRTIEPEWNDAAAEEAFARLYNSATVRSRNFRVVVTGQAVRGTRNGETKVLATRSRLYHVFIRPIRDGAGNLVRQQTEIIYARTL
jgi:hypothetical protein